MLFIEPVFIVFFLITAGVYWLMTSHDWRKMWLLAASYVFYGAWDWRFLFLMMGCSAFNYVLALVVERQLKSGPAHAWVLPTSIIANLSVLFFFKYFNFFAASLSELAAVFGATVSPVTLQVVLPVGISFFTFQAMSYFFDVYRKEIPAEKSIIDVSLYIAFFPQLVAGPIVRAADFLPQLTRRRFFSDVNIRASLLLFAIGFIKKACIADGLAPYVDRVFADPATFDAFSIFSAVIFYAMQIYCDFSGYSDMAIAAAGLLGYHLVINFRAPYFSVNITEFWRRWHISLSTWLRDYLYIPLGGNRHGPRRRDRNLMLTMILGGLWHGASYNFIVWGFMHGLALIVRREWATHRPAIGGHLPLARFFSGVLTFYWVCIAWIFFRATTLPAALDMTHAFVTFQSNGTEQLALGVPWTMVVVLMAAQWADQRYGIVKRIETISWPAFYGGLGTASAFALALVPGGARPFIYFQF